MRVRSFILAGAPANTLLRTLRLSVLDSQHEQVPAALDSNLVILDPDHIDERLQGCVPDGTDPTLKFIARRAAR
jgi:hypothetical protein